MAETTYHVPPIATIKARRLFIIGALWSPLIGAMMYGLINVAPQTSMKMQAYLVFVGIGAIMALNMGIVLVIAQLIRAIVLGFGTALGACCVTFALTRPILAGIFMLMLRIRIPRPDPWFYLGVFTLTWLILLGIITQILVRLAQSKTMRILLMLMIIAGSLYTLHGLVQALR